MANDVPFKSLDAVTATGAGVVLDVRAVTKDVTMQVYVTGSPSTCTVAPEGSMDGVTYYGLGIANATGSAMVTGGDHHVRYLRANVTQLSGGSSPTVTAYLAHGETF